MSQGRNGAAVGTSIFVVLALLIGYGIVTIVNIPLGLILSGGKEAGTCLSSGTIVAAAADPSTSPTAATETTQLPQETLDRIEAQNIRGRAEQNMERYAYAEEQTGVPWAVVAALHYRESGMRGESSVLNGQPIVGTPYINIDGQTVGANPKEDAVNAANALKRLAGGVYDVDVTAEGLTLEDWGWAFLAYNRGYLFKRVNASYTVSPYVMNGLDDQHMNMRWSSADTVSGVDGNKIGALAMLTYLDGQPLAGGSCSASAASGAVVAPIKSDNIIITSSAGQRARFSGYLGRRVNRIHFGLDLKGGSEILAISAGTVTLAQNGYYGLGTAVKIDHGNGTQSLYGHMVHGSLKVKVGDIVNAGQTLGTMGTTGDSDGVHLHLEVWLNDVRINPYPFLIENGIKLTWDPRVSRRNETPGPFEG